MLVIMRVVPPSAKKCIVSVHKILGNFRGGTAAIGGDIGPMSDDALFTGELTKKVE